MNPNYLNDFSQAQLLLGNEVDKVSQNDLRIPKPMRRFFDNLNVRLDLDLIAAACGTSQDLCVIVLPVRNQVENNILKDFLEQNPSLRTTVITRSSQLVYVWLRINSWRPANRELPGALWISLGIVPFGLSLEPQLGSRLESIGGVSVVMINFWGLKWNSRDYETFLLEMMESRYGDLFLPGRRIRKEFGVYTAAHFFVRRCILDHVILTDIFTAYSPETGLIKIKQENLKATIYTWLSRQARLRNVPYPSGDPEGEIINMIKHICATEQAERNSVAPKA